MEVLNSSLNVVQLPLCTYSCLYSLCTLQALLVPLVSAMGPRAMTWQQEVTSVSVTKGGGESGVTIPEIVRNLKIVALIPTFVMVMGGVFGMKPFERIAPDVCVTPAGIWAITVSIPWG